MKSSLFVSAIAQPLIAQPLIAQPLIASLASLLLQIPAQAIEEAITVVSYPVQGGRTAAEIRENINRQQRAATGVNFDAIAYWSVSWDYWYEPTATGCVFTEVNVTLTGKIVMPQIVSPVSAALRQQWQEYHRRLMAHEQQHIQHGREAAQAIERKLTGMSAPTCDQLQTQGNAYGESAIANGAQRDRAYDQRTNHGETEGVRFP